METLVYLVYIAIILLVGLGCSYLSKKLAISRILLLIIAGRILFYLRYQGQRLMIFPTEFVAVIGVFAFAMVVFDAASRLKLKEFDTFVIKALTTSIILFIANVLFLTLATKFLFNVSWLHSVIFAALMSGTSAGAVALLKKKTHKVYEMLRIEAMISTPLAVLLPFILLDIMGIAAFAAKTDILTVIIEQVGPFLLQFIIGIGAGLLVGLIMTRFFSKRYAAIVSPIALMTSVLVAYVLAEMLKGNGVVAVTIYGLFYGNIFIRQKMELREFSGTIAVFLEIMVFTLLGLVMPMPQDIVFILSATLIFLMYLCMRFIVIELSFKKHEFTFREKMFMTFHTQKGIAVAAATIALLSYSIAHSALISTTTPQFSWIYGGDKVLCLLFINILLSVIISTIAVKCSDYFLRVRDH